MGSGTDKKILLSGVIKSKKAYLASILAGMLLITLLAGAACFAAEFRTMINGRWEDLYYSLNYNIDSLGIAEIERFCLNNDRTGDYQAFSEAVKSGADALDIARLYVYDRENKDYYYLHIGTCDAQRHGFPEFFRLVSGCADDSRTDDDKRAEESEKPVYSYDMDHSCIKAWTTVTSGQGRSYTVFGEAWIDPIIEECLTMAHTVFLISALVSAVMFIFIYFGLIGPILRSVSELSDDMDRFYLTGELQERQSQDQLIQKLRGDFFSLAVRNTKYAEQQKAEAQESAAAVQMDLIDAAAVGYLQPAGCTYIPGKQYPEIHSKKISDNAAEGCFCDFFNIGEDKVGFIVCSLPEGNDSYALPLFVKYMFRTEMSDLSDLGASARNMSDLLIKQFGGRYKVGAFFGYIADDRSIHYVNAGYNIPFYMTEKERPDFLPGECSQYLGEEGDYKVGSNKLRSGDCVVCFSEGVIDEPDSQGGRYGRDRLRAVLNDWRLKTNTSKNLTVAVINDLSAHHGDGDFEFEKLFMVIQV